MKKAKCFLFVLLMIFFVVTVTACAGEDAGNVKSYNYKQIIMNVFFSLLALLPGITVLLIMISKGKWNITLWLIAALLMLIGVTVLHIIKVENIRSIFLSVIAGILFISGITILINMIMQYKWDVRLWILASLILLIGVTVSLIITVKDKWIIFFSVIAGILLLPGVTALMNAEIKNKNALIDSKIMKCQNGDFLQSPLASVFLPEGMPETPSETKSEE